MDNGDEHWLTNMQMYLSLLQDISGCDVRVTDVGIGRLSDLHHLRTLSLAYCEQVSDVGLSQLLGLPAGRNRHSSIHKTPAAAVTGGGSSRTSSTAAPLLALFRLSQPVAGRGRGHGAVTHTPGPSLASPAMQQPVPEQCAPPPRALTSLDISGCFELTDASEYGCV